MARGRAVRSTQGNSQRSRRNESPEPSQDEERSAQESGDENMNEPDEGANAQERLANDIVRLALFAEGRRSTFKRDDISKKVFGSKGTRNFSAVFDRAQDTLRNVFGMEIVEVPSRAERDAAEKALDEKGKPTKAPAKKPPAGPKVWMVRSTLDADIIAAANAPDAEILSKERDRLPNPSNHPLKNADEPFLQSDGSVFAWCASDQLGSMGLLGVVLSLILVNGKELTDQQLRGYLKNLRLPLEAAIPFQPISAPANKKVTVEEQLGAYIKGGYLEKYKVANPMNGPSATQQQGGKRARGGKGSDDPDAQYLWKWGGRAFTEIGEEAVVDFVAALMVERPAALDNEEEEDVTAAKKAKETETMRKSIIKSAGGHLLGSE